MGWSLRIFIQRPNQPPRQNWHYPPDASSTSSRKPQAAQYFLKNLFIWMPKKMWEFQYLCPIVGSNNLPCNRPLRDKSLYKKTRKLFDLADYYYLVTEYLDCMCGGIFVGWDKRLIEKLPFATRRKFPALLTYQKSIDKNLVRLLRSRTLGNSPTALRNTIQNNHSVVHVERSAQFFQDCIRYTKGGIPSTFLSDDDIAFECPPKFEKIPSSQLFLTVYSRNVIDRREVLKGNITSVFGDILKIDSTKNILKNLGKEKDTPAG